MLFHITDDVSWATHRTEAGYEPPSLKAEGFIHLSQASQLHETIRRHFKGAASLLLVEVDEELLEAELRWEEGEPGELFPHLYGPLPMSAVADVRSLTVTTTFA